MGISWAVESGKTLPFLFKGTEALSPSPSFLKCLLIVERPVLSGGHPEQCPPELHGELCQHLGLRQPRALPSGSLHQWPSDLSANSPRFQARGGFKSHTSQPLAFTSCQQDTKFVSALALDRPAVGGVFGRALGLPLVLQRSSG